MKKQKKPPIRVKKPDKENGHKTDKWIEDKKGLKYIKILGRC